MPGDTGRLEKLRQLAERGKGVPGELEQRQLFEQVTTVLRTLAAGRPLLLLLDDSAEEAVAVDRRIPASASRLA